MSDSSQEKNRLNRLKNTLNGKWLVLALFLLLISLTWQCASIQQPTGGPKDSIPPKILNESPPNLTRNFDAEEVIISFDEFIKLADEFKEISISPDMGSRPFFKVNRRNLEITLPDSLEDSTTYTINFGKAIVDFNESNPLLNYSYVFSTGDIIDSLSIMGRVIDALSLEPAMQTTVMLIPTSRDSIFGKQKANIFTLTDSSGNFVLRNLREDTYRIYALQEENNDRTYNAPEELIGFLNDSFYLDKDTSGIHLQLSKGIPETFRLLDRKIEPSGKVIFAFNKPLWDPVLTVTHPAALDESKIVSYNKTADSASMWLADLTFDSLKVQFADGSRLLDSVTIRRGRNEKYDRDFTITDRLGGNRVNRVQHIKLVAGAPVQSIDRSKIILTLDSVPVNNYQLIKDTTENFSYLLRYNWRPEIDYTLTIEEGAFTGYFGDKNKPYSKNFTYDQNENFGDIVFNIVPADTSHQYVVELINEKKDFTYRHATIKTPEKIPFRQLRGGKYTLRVIYDKNNNGKWDPGNVRTKQQPERVWYMGKTFIIRPNWEQEEVINIPE